VLLAAPCNATLLRVRSRFNCEEDWSCADDIVSALKYTGVLKRTSGISYVKR